MEHKRTDNSTVIKKENAWVELSTTFNSITIKDKRNENGLRACWKNLKAKTKDMQQLTVSQKLRCPEIGRLCIITAVIYNAI